MALTTFSYFCFDQSGRKAESANVTVRNCSETFKFLGSPVFFVEFDAEVFLYMRREQLEEFVRQAQAALAPAVAPIAEPIAEPEPAAPAKSECLGCGKPSTSPVCSPECEEKWQAEQAEEEKQITAERIAETSDQNEGCFSQNW